MIHYRVKYETGPVAADCYSKLVYAESRSAAEEVVLAQNPRAYVTSVEEVKESTMTSVTINGVNAQMARRATDKARSLDGDYKRAETNKILESIQAAAAKGLDSVQTGSVDDVVAQRLRNLGFKVIWTDGYDQRDPGYTTISW